ncbi:hypothetical protein BpHYR1_048291 [Brachionus plicatilis]|uniref:Uncharacterized protein n=1 Tax=Brachionus plicatilis TaxID=10195 RepID=A0A3M7RU20_BRAPC|nr:hypothetical protein BpHYR1_048291 [Brachionus plicatilis]
MTSKFSINFTRKGQVMTLTRISQDHQKNNQRKSGENFSDFWKESKGTILQTSAAGQTKVALLFSFTEQVFDI